MRAAKKCGPTRGMRSTAYSIKRLRRPLRNLPQNSPELLIPHIPAVVAKAVLVQIGLQILRADVVVDAADPAFHQTPESFDSLGVNVARDVNLRAVTDAPMDVAEILESIVRNEIVGEHCARRQDVFLRQAVKSFLFGVRSYTRHNPTNLSVGAALDHAHDRDFVTPVRRTALSALMLSLSAVVHLIHLHRRTLQLQTILGQETPNLAEHAPRCFVSDACLPLNLLCGDSAASRTHEVHRVKPKPQRSGSFLEHGPGQRVDVIPADLARIRGAASHAVVLALDAALLALSYPVRPALLFDVLKAGVVVRKLAVKIRDCVAQMLGNTLSRFHL